MYALTQSGLPEKSPRPPVWAKHMALEVLAGDESLDTLDTEMEKFEKFTNICKPTSLHLCLRHSWFNTFHVASLANMPLKRLTLLDFRCRHYLSPPKDEIALGFLRGLSQLQELVLEGVVFAGAHFELLRDKNLSVLSLPYTENGYITDVTMVSKLAEDFPALRVLVIPNLLSRLVVPADVLDGQLNAWAAFEQLEVLNISYSPISSLAFVRKLLKIKILSINRCTKLTDDAFEDLTYLLDLCEVNFGDNPVLTQNCATHLGRLSLTTVTFRDLDKLHDEWVEKLLLSDATRPVVRKVAIYDTMQVTSKVLSCLELLPSLLELCLTNCEGVIDMSPLMLLHLERLYLEWMEKVDWATLHGLICGTVSIIDCSFAPHVTVELRRTGGGVLVHTEVGTPFFHPYPLFQHDGSFNHRTVMPPPLLH